MNDQNPAEKTCATSGWSNSAKPAARAPISSGATACRATSRRTAASRWAAGGKTACRPATEGSTVGRSACTWQAAVRGAAQSATTAYCSDARCVGRARGRGKASGWWSTTIARAKGFSSATPRVSLRCLHQLSAR